MTIYLSYVFDLNQQTFLQRRQYT